MYKKLVLIICLLFSVGSAFAFNICLNQQASCQSGDIKSPEEPPIHASINGDMFTATFLEDLGSVSVSISTAGGGRVFDQAILCTPNGVGCRIPHPGHFIVTFTLADGTVYEGEFEVE